MERYRTVADVLFADEPAETEFSGAHARIKAVAFARGLMSGNPGVIQVSLWESCAGGWRYLGTWGNDLYAGSYPNPAGL